MAGFVAAAEQHFHVRSISLPSTSHPTAARAEEELHKLRACVASSSALLSERMICNALSALGVLYDRVEELLHLPSNQLVLLQPQEKKQVEEELNASVRLLDLCSGMKDDLAAVKERAQELQSALRRKGDMSCKTKAFMQLANKAKKDAKKCVQAMSSQKDAKQEPCSDLQKVVMVMAEAREIAISLLGSVAALMSPRPKHKGRKWSFVRKAMSKRRVACEGELEDDQVFTLYSIYESISCKGADSLKVTQAQDQLKKMVSSFGDLEAGLECVYRRIIQNRVILLNLHSL